MIHTRQANRGLYIKIFILIVKVTDEDRREMGYSTFWGKLGCALPKKINSLYQTIYLALYNYARRDFLCYSFLIFKNQTRSFFFEVLIFLTMFFVKIITMCCMKKLFPSTGKVECERFPWPADSLRPEPGEGEAERS